MSERESDFYPDPEKEAAVQEALYIFNEGRRRMLDAAQHDQKGESVVNRHTKEEFKRRRTIPIVSHVSEVLSEISGYTKEEKRVVGAAQELGIGSGVIIGFKVAYDSGIGLFAAMGIAGGATWVTAGLLLFPLVGAIAGYGLGRLVGIGIVKGLHAVKRLKRK